MGPALFGLLCVACTYSSSSTERVDIPVDTRYCSVRRYKAKVPYTILIIDTDISQIYN